MRPRKSKPSSSHSILHHFQISHIFIIQLLLKLLVFHAIICHVQLLSYFIKTPVTNGLSMFVDALDCERDEDCYGESDKICHDNKCICEREKPIEFGGNCLGLHVIDDQCQVDAQCLGNSKCLDGLCSCANDAIKVWNPSNKLNYCHLKRQLFEKCNYDPQCPENSYCSSEKVGCLCLNGYAPALVKDQNRRPDEGDTTTTSPQETYKCLEVSCQMDSDCNSEFHSCQDFRCTCLPTHFDPTNARCYKFGSTGGVDADQNKTRDNLIDTSASGDQNGGIYTIFNDLRKIDIMWVVIVVIIVLTLVVLALILLLPHRMCHCWTTRKQEWDPKVGTLV